MCDVIPAITNMSKEKKNLWSTLYQRKSKAISSSELHNMLSPLLYTGHRVIMNLLKKKQQQPVLLLSDFSSVWVIFYDYIRGQVSLWESAGVTEELTDAKDSPDPGTLSCHLFWVDPGTI